ncbi:hypothetical protein EW146_g4587 [Bondarzewia mesenterica]|uniref:C3H1-type domain-containing protein n=1 Tax=Bondarzewia mesenterica TaxID=1095465 RepID=A0A4S4LU48_9AGAM|nr:hypothetical protein EW146_g4587 [Bondarzewia mesenterica]
MRELSVWKAAHKTVDNEKTILQRTVIRLERNIDGLKDDNPLTLCLIDGDGTIFSQDLWAAGRTGGRQAAALLTKGIVDHVAGVDESSSNRGQLWVTIYCNKTGLMETLVKNRICEAEQFESFLHGFNQASPLFSIVDVGNVKEAADTKIKEYLRVFTCFPQTSRVYFGGAHDNGYTSTLNLLDNEGFLDKVVLLRGYRNLAVELKNLNLPHLEIEGLFMTQKLQSNTPKKISANPYNSEYLMGSPSLEERTLGPRVIDPNLPLSRHKPPPCNFFYLSNCRQGTKCHYGHDYSLTPENLSELRVNAKKSPCYNINKNTENSPNDREHRNVSPSSIADSARWEEQKELFTSPQRPSPNYYFGSLS